MDLSATNSLLRLQPENSNETPIDKYIRYKSDHQEWINDTIQFGLNDHERSILWKYLSDAYGLADSQEKIMRLSMDSEVSGYSLKEANKLRKSIAKKDPQLQAAAKEQFYEYGRKLGTREVFLDYIWNVLFSMSMGYSLNA
jgi:DNA polymerase-3 subunit alpha